ncbi:zinc finger and SCAN domain-containing protein 12-like [Mercenaria mercenaria]|uniref:zinc finger and SCAN domain-containing protein 12-like n=1 Tax=Mercenaria mercenaria TaxID=6596 RepID=UPI00234F7E74|nr:zinc finger and SCAN domain-containing protein 12-like [Mercenaria mercenaria]
MDEGGTLDFEDLMDTGDEFPGFEIAKFTPANESEGNDDGVLRTPEHEKDDEDYIINEKRNNHDVQADRSDQDNDSAEVPGVEDIVNNLEGVVNEETNDEVVEIAKDNLDKNEENTVDDVTMTEPTETGDNKPDIVVSDHEENGVKAGPADHQSEENVDNNEDILEITSEDVNHVGHKDQDINDVILEPVPKKKKMYLKPPQKKKTLLESKKLERESEDMEEETAVESGRTRRSSENSRDSHDASENGEEEYDKKSEETEKKNNEEEEEPHQQSFLSFLNLKPGTSKPKKDDERQKEETLQKEFYSRKRLRTRKKVSYCEDVAQDDDDEYNVEDDEDEDYDEDHQFENRRNNRSRSNSRRNSGTAQYANALQQLLPGVDLSCLQSSQIRISPKENNVAKCINMDSLKPQGNVKGLFECGLCGVFFNTASQFITHQESVHAGEKKNGKSAMETFRCEVCGFVLTNRFAYLEHKKMKHARGGAVTFSCSKCKINKFTDIGALQKHQQVCGIPFCSTCGATFKAWVEVAEHRKKAHAPAVPTRQWLNCANKTCSFKCVTQHEMRQHIQAKHMVNDLFTCNAPRCTRAFNTRELLTEHKKEAHASEFIVQYQCMECKNCFSSKTLLAEHQYLHTLEKLRKCDLCLRQFGNVNDLRKHKDVHAVKGTIRCQSCFRWCVDKIELVNHVCAQKRRNIGIRLYFCDVCHKDFRSDEKMFIHRKEHKNFFQCGMCFLEFNSEAEYFEHREVHGKFTCKECCEEMDEKDVEMHAKAHKYYIKLEDMENNGKSEKVMFLCPNLFNAIQA